MHIRSRRRTYHASATYSMIIMDQGTDTNLRIVMNNCRSIEQPGIVLLHGRTLVPMLRDRTMLPASKMSQAIHTSMINADHGD